MLICVYLILVAVKMRVAATILLFLLLKFSFGQNNYSLKVIGTDKPAEFFAKKFSYKTAFKDSIQAKEESETLVSKLRSFGYFGSSLDSIYSDSAQMYTYIYVGEKFENLYLKNGNIETSLLADAGVRSFLNGKAVSPDMAEMVKARIIRQCENSGFPFASVRLDSFEIIESRYSAKVYLEKHDLVLLDTMQILGQTKVKRIFLKNYLGLRTGKPYNEANITRITQRLSELQFVEPLKPYTVEFSNGKARVNLFLKDKKSSQFDFLLGLLPGSSGKKVLITGEARIHLFSLFGVGEEFFLEWQKVQPKTQRLDVRVVYPYLVGLPVGINARFELYKRDTSFLDLNGDYGIQYQLAGSNYLKASLRQKITIITNVDTNYVKQTRRLPRNMDVTGNQFALEYFLQKLDYRFNPTSGYVLRVDGAAGVKVIRKNNNIVGLFDEVKQESFGYLYDTTKLKTFQFHVGASIDKYWRLAARHTIKTSAEGKYMFNRNIFENEKFRIGGVKSLRGFDDQSIFTPYYAMANLEYRFLLSKNSFFNAFFNAAVVEDTRIGKQPVDFPFGFGVGAAIETKVGIFGITYAMGKQLDNKVSFNSAKIHFGYVNYF